MKSVLPIALALASLTCVPNTTLAQRRGENASDFGWEFNYKSGLETARRTGKPLMVVFRCAP